MVIKQIPMEPNYAVSDQGNVYSITENGLVELKNDISNEYARVKLSGKKYYVSSLVAEVFLRPQPGDNYKLFYIDGDKLNCAKENLTWLTPEDIQRYSHYTKEYRQIVLGEW